MMFESLIRPAVQAAFHELYGKHLGDDAVVLQSTRKEFSGDLTLVVFGLAKLAGTSPDAVGKAIAEHLAICVPEVKACNLVKGFLNIELHDSAWMEALFTWMQEPEPHRTSSAAFDTSHPVLVEYSSPNTNKPLHLGHIRNNLLGFSVAELLKAVHTPVTKVNLINDRGIHICKSMLAWLKQGNGETPESSGMKGDHLVGKYYVEFDRMYKAEISQLTAEGKSEEEAKRDAPSMVEARELLLKWEAGDQPTVELWKKMNAWVYTGFESTYARLGVDFDTFYYESETYLLGKSIVQDGLDRGVFYRKEDGSVWVDLTDEGLDHKLLLRGDGTSVYITQDLGTAKQRYDETGFSKLIYVVGNEQDYHFKVLKLILKKLGFSWWDSLVHLSYNMVDLPSGKMKSREGTVVDADELMQEMVDEAARITRELGKIDDFSSDEARELYETIGLGALKYFILKVDPEKRMLFNPEESIDFNGHTGPFIQYTYARIRSVLRKAASMEEFADAKHTDPRSQKSVHEKERELVMALLRYRESLEEAAGRFSPAVMANYAYELAKVFNSFYHECPIVDQAQPDTTRFRVMLCTLTAGNLLASLSLLGIRVPERM
ncbi:MAG: arginine--tRNA ligase [Bacteroidota bacterium]